MRLLVCGGRNYINGRHIYEVLDRYAFTILICGMARGADSIAYQYARSKGISIQPFPAKWDLYGRLAGRIRNTQMLKEGKPDVIVAFPGGAGTANMAAQGHLAGVEVHYA